MPTNKKRKGKMVLLELAPDLMETLNREQIQRNESRSALIRRAIRREYQEKGENKQ